MKEGLPSVPKQLLKWAVMFMGIRISLNELQALGFRMFFGTALGGNCSALYISSAMDVQKNWIDLVDWFWHGYLWFNCHCLPLPPLLKRSRRIWEHR